MVATNLMLMMMVMIFREVSATVSPYVRGGLAVPGINIWAISEWWRWRWRWRRRMMGDVMMDDDRIP